MLSFFSHLLVLLLVAGFMLYQRKKLVETLAAIAVTFAITSFVLGTSYFFWSLLIVVAVIALPTPFRKNTVSAPILNVFRKVLPPMTSTEQEALEAGDVWWDGELFQGNPDWNKLLAYPKPTLTAEEQSFIDNECEQLCALIDDFAVNAQDRDLTPEAWDFIKKAGFLSLIIPKEYGGKGFSALANSTIVTKLATRSCAGAVTVMVPNSLGPGELLMHYGTKEQKDYYLPRLARGDDIPCFALTSPVAGSDAGAIPDTGIVCKGMHDGKEVIGIRLNWNKRYITLAPVATVLGLAFKLYDPDKLMGDKTDYGITVCLIPTNHPGVETGRRHLPMGMAFMNGPTTGKDVFIPLDWIVGGPAYAGQGWRMLVECLGAGRGISLPALATATSKVCYRMTGAYARIRKQFKTAIGQFEGVEEAMARIAGRTYQLEAARTMTVGALDLGAKPAVVTAIAKYHMTEMGRASMQDAMDVHAGRGVIMGPNNYLSAGYMAQPIAITVEGANILTRNLMIFGQGAVRCHPFVYKEMQAAANTDKAQGLKEFDDLLFKHIGYAMSNFVRAFVLSVTAGRAAMAPTEGETKRHFEQLTRFSAALAMVADVAMLTLGGDLKRKERLSARLGDVLSNLYLASAALKFFHDNGCNPNELPYVRWAVRNALFECQHAFAEFFANYPMGFMGSVMKRIVLPWGKRVTRANDKLDHQVVAMMMKDNEVRDRITQYLYLGAEDQPLARMEAAFKAVIAAADADRKLSKAARKGGLIELSGPYTYEDVLKQAVAANVISEMEAQLLREAERRRNEVIQVDAFNPGHYAVSAIGDVPTRSGKAA